MDLQEAIDIMTKNERNLSAYITLEAAMIVPLILLVVLIFLCASFYLHDKTVLTSEMHAFIDKYASSFNTDGCETDTAVFSEMLTDRITKSEISNISVDRTTFKINISATVSFQLPPIFKSMLKFGLFTTDISMSMARIDRTEAARILSVVAETACEIKGLKGLIEKAVKK
jgi:hypothetical protein